jgi:prolyl oligopeptidase PreP (S9A serine peptidase family)
MTGVDEVIRMGVADPERLGVMGGSYGGFMTFWVITQTNRFKAAIGHAGISDWYSFHGQSDIPGLMEYGFGGTPWTARETYEKWSPVRYADRVKTPLLITHGEQDQARAHRAGRAILSRFEETRRRNRLSSATRAKVTASSNRTTRSISSGGSWSGSRSI